MKKQISILLTLLSVSVVFAQSDPQAFTRKILIEQFTTAKCGHCPAGAERLLTATQGLSNVVWIRYHAGFYTDDLTNDISERMTRFYGGSTFAPAMMVDRTRFNTSNPGPVMSVGTVSEIRQYLSQAKSVKTYCKVQVPEVEYDAATRTLVCRVRGRFSDEVYGPNTVLQVLLVEDSVFMRQSDYGVGSYVDYWHLGVVRDTLTYRDGIQVEVSTEADHSFLHTFTYTLPEEYVFRHCKVAAIVYNYDYSDINNCQVLNAAISDYISQNLGIGEVSESASVRLFPNPANGFAVIESESPMLRVSVVDAMGRCPLMIPADGEQRLRLDLSSLPTGLYIVRVQTASGMATRQLILR